MEYTAVNFKEQVARTTEILERYVRKNADFKEINITTVCLAYVLYKALFLVDRNEHIESITVYDVFSEIGELNVFLDRIVNEKLFNDAKYLLRSINRDIFKHIVLYKSISTYRDESTPESIINLSNAILNIDNNDRILDICSGRGDFIFKTANRFKNCHYTGIEINTTNASIAKIRAELYGENIDILNMDAFAYNFSNEKYNKVFSNFPFGVKNFKFRYPFLSEFDSYLGEHKLTQDDWYFVNLAVRALDDKGKAVCIMRNGSLFNSIISERKAREYFVENGFVEAVIALPNNIYSTFGIQTAIVVLSKDNHGIRFIDATDIHTVERRLNKLSDENINEILELLSVDSNISKTVDIGDIRNNEYNLYPVRYLKRQIEYKNGVKFESIIKSITRGSAISARELDNISSSKPTKYKYLMLANIKDGIINDELPYITEIEEKYNKYCLKKNDLIMSKNGYPFKIAIVSDIKDDEKILANGNLYINRR